MAFSKRFGILWGRTGRLTTRITDTDRQFEHRHAQFAVLSVHCFIINRLVCSFTRRSGKRQEGEEKTVRWLFGFRAPACVVGILSQLTCGRLSSRRHYGCQRRMEVSPSIMRWIFLCLACFEYPYTLTKRVSSLYNKLKMCILQKIISTFHHDKVKYIDI